MQKPVGIDDVQFSMMIGDKTKIQRPTGDHDDGEALKGFSSLPFSMPTAS